MQANIAAYDSRAVPPLFTYSVSDENFDLDFGLLSEYIAEDERLTGKHDSYGFGRQDMYSNDASDNEGCSSDEDGKRKRFSGDNTKPRSKEQMDRRRERNRVLAKKTRLRKKFFFESLQRQVAQLATENDMLKTIVKQRLNNEVKSEILAQCRTEVPSIITPSVSNATTLLESADYKLMSVISAAQRSFVITDPSLPDNPIIFASQGFLELSGYKLDEVLGRNCRFMQGPKTDQAQVEVLRNGIRDGVDTAVCLLNYKRNGTQFYNQIFVAALRDSSRKIINYVGVQVEIKDYDENENMVQDISNNVRYSTKVVPPDRNMYSHGRADNKSTQGKANLHPSTFFNQINSNSMDDFLNVFDDQDQR